jgi:hypothetical protein
MLWAALVVFVLAYALAYWLLGDEVSEPDFWK